MTPGTGDRFPLLVGDIGGTNARFGWVRHAGAPLSDVSSVLCAEYPRPEDAARSYLDRYQADVRPSHAAIAIAGAVSRGPIKVTNSHWILERDAFARGIGSSAIDIFNDFEAIALVLPHLTPSDYQLVGAAVPNLDYPMGVIGPGTGLGVGGTVPVRGARGGWQSWCGEGGHVTLAAATEYQLQVLLAARTGHPHLSAEQLVSGTGLPTLRDAVAEVEGLAIERPMDATEICTLGAARTDRLCERTMEAFCSFLGCVAGNVALTLGARGGLFIAGGIVPRLGDFFTKSAFRQQFEAKGRYEDYLRAISTPVITAANPGLQGLARAAAAP
jgi:glucokinase